MTSRLDPFSCNFPQARRSKMHAMSAGDQGPPGNPRNQLLEPPRKIAAPWRCAWSWVKDCLVLRCLAVIFVPRIFGDFFMGFFHPTQLRFLSKVEVFFIVFCWDICWGFVGAVLFRNFILYNSVWLICKKSYQMKWFWKPNCWVVGFKECLVVVYPPLKFNI